MPKFVEVSTEDWLHTCRDASRYRWLRSEDACTNPKFYGFWEEFTAKLCREEKMDAAIDGAMKRQS